MAGYDGSDDVQTQTPAVPVLGAGFVQLVEPVENQGQFVRRDGLTLIGDGGIDFIASLPDFQTQGPSLGAEFDCVIDQIVSVWSI